MKRCLLSVALMVASTAGWAQSVLSVSEAAAQGNVVSQDTVSQDTPQVASHKVMMDFGNPTINTNWANAQKALEEHRWVKPSGNNAIEYYLAAHSAVLAQPKAKTNYVEITTDALRSLFPYALLAAEAAVERNDTVEANRLIGLLEQMDPQAPAVQRLRSGAAPVATP